MIQAAVMTREEFAKATRAYDKLHNCTTSDLELERSWSRYAKIVLVKEDK